MDDHLPSRHPDVGARCRRLDDLIARQRPAGVGPSVVLAIESLDGAFRWSAGAGPASRTTDTPMSAHSPYFAASVTKLFVATVVLQLRREGLVDLGTPLVEVVPHDLTGLHVLGGVDRTAELTVGQALAHATGLPNYLEDVPRGGRTLLDEVLAADRAWGLDEVVARSRSVLRPRFAPGSGNRAHYSDTNYQLLGAAIEHLTGRSLAEVIDDRIARPLGLKNTRMFDPTRDDIDAIATLYAGDRVLRHPLLLGSVGADGGLVTSAADSLTFLRALWDGAVVPPADVAAMQARWRRIFFPFRYGLGMMRFRLPRLLTMGRPITLIGHSGSTGALAFVVPERGLLVAGTLNQMEPRSLSIKLALRAISAVPVARR